jgi:tetratricopeptide (TPR) repeat protein
MSNPVFIGRQAELLQLKTFLDNATLGEAQVVFIAGEAGAGKSSLVAEFIRRQEEADPKLIASIGECNAQTGIADPYLPFRQLLTSLTTGNEAEKTPKEIDEKKKLDRWKEFVQVSTRTLIMLGPDLVGIFVPGAQIIGKIGMAIGLSSNLSTKLSEKIGKKSGKESPKIDPALDQEKIFEQYAAVLKVLSKDRTLVLVLDDLQWADSGSINLLFHLARQLKDSRILLLGTYRPDDVALGRAGGRHPLEPVLNELKRYHGNIVIDLSQAEAREGRLFVDALLDAEPNHLNLSFRDELFAHTGGQPLFTVELLRNLREQGHLVKDTQGSWVQVSKLDWESLPARLEGVIGERVTRLPADLHETLTIASVIGQEFAAQVVGRVQNVDERELVRNLSRELDKRYLLVVEQGEIKIGKLYLSQYRFAHFLLQQYLYDELSAGERRIFHGEIADTLETLYAGQTDEIALQLAHHFEEAGNAEKAIRYWTLAGNSAYQVYAQNEAIATYTRALELGKEATLETEQLRHLYSRRGRAMELLGQFEQALKDYDEMLSTARERQDRRMELDAMMASSTLYSTPTAVMNPEKGQALSEEALKLAKELGDQSIECKVLWNLLLANLHGGKVDQAIDYGERSLSLASSLNLREQLAYTLTDLGRAYSTVCRFEEAESRLREAAGLWRELGNMPMLNDNLNALLLNHFWAGKYKNALEIAQESLEVSRITKNIWAQCWPRHLQGQIWFKYGEIDRALDELDASVRLAQEANASIHTKWYSANLSWAYIQVGAVQKGMDLYRATRIPNAELPMILAWNSTAASYALCEIATGQIDLATSTISARHISNGVADYTFKLVQCKLALARKDLTQAKTIIDTVLENIRKYKIDQFLSEALFLKGQAHLMNGERELAKAAFEEARLAAEALGSRWLLWQILSALAGVESEDGKSSALKSQAREIIQFIADHIHEDEMRSQFLQSEGVLAICSSNAGVGISGISDTD